MNTPRKRRRKDAVGTIRVPDRFRDVVGDLSGVALLQALYFLNEGERIGREGTGFAEQMRQIHMGVCALLERAAQQPPLPDNLIPFRPQVKRPERPSGGAAAPPGVTVADAQDVRRYCQAVAGGDERLANAAYARVMEDASGGGKLNSRWQTMAEDAVEQARAKVGLGALSVADMSLFADQADAQEVDDPEEAWTEGN